MTRAHRIVVVACFCAVGCGGQKIVPVSGRVTLDGKPLANATVSFQPITQEGSINPGAGSVGRTDADGRYTLQIPNERVNGAYAGKHRVEISVNQKEGPTGDPNTDRLERLRNLVPPRYNTNTELERTVEPSGSQEFNFELTSQ